ncbi:hypothetical protein JMJ77_0003213 [Colletotrichum scovillei]|uniref:Uncharacterized protein n=1 Tax=Colletotrichum scovillei TaxID=1209932 RepID=A0A9P7U9Y9_9PEZI|nr:hypothetical protein JMJ78_0006428 [Colletotrichum scovillei]KAG7043509.1 hypothetical protein JMJ77_0003213 [Colletotrichum scovillei]KAG7062958.1 hypothetical protein JMJ76_0009799 [Colletotrichum scovillei]
MRRYLVVRASRDQRAPLAGCKKPVSAHQRFLLSDRD